MDFRRIAHALLSYTRAISAITILTRYCQLLCSSKCLKSIQHFYNFMRFYAHLLSFRKIYMTQLDVNYRCTWYPRQWTTINRPRKRKNLICQSLEKLRKLTTSCYLNVANLYIRYYSRICINSLKRAYIPPNYKSLCKYTEKATQFRPFLLC